MDYTQLAIGIAKTLSPIVSAYNRGFNSTPLLLEDRAHTEMREDTAYQRAVKDMQAAGLNPYTVGSNPAPSSSSSVGANTIQNQLQMLGYILDLGNLSVKNRATTNNLIGDLLNVFFGKK